MEKNKNVVMRISDDFENRNTNSDNALI